MSKKKKVTSTKLGTAIIRLNTDCDWDGRGEKVRAPEYRGSLLINGVEYRLSLWIDARAGTFPLKLSGQVTTVPAREEEP